MQVWTISYLDIFIRLLLAFVLGGVIGIEREQNNHPAGFRTHILVSLGSTLIMLISIYGFTDFLYYENVRFDPSRVAAQVVTGIGFLGAGTILRHGYTVTGLTTAASLWVVAAIGMAIGSGFYFGAILATVFVLISLSVLTKMDFYIAKKKRLVEIRVHVQDTPGKLGVIATALGEKKIDVKSVSILEEDNEKEIGISSVNIVFKAKLPKNLDITEVVDKIKQLDGVKEIQFGNDID